MNTCPVCGYNELEYPPVDNNICPSCGTEFDYHDRRYTHAQLRQQWIQIGARWWDLDMRRPHNWDSITQLRNIGYTATPDDIEAIERNRLPVHFTMEFGPIPDDAAEVELMKQLVAA